MINFTTFSNDWLLYGLFTTAALGTRPTSWFIGLHTGDPGAAGANEVTAVNDSAYVRKAVTFAEDVALSGTLDVLSNVAEVAFDAAGTGANYTVTWMSIWDASTAGNCLARAKLPGAGVNVVEGSVFKSPAESIVLRTRAPA